MPSDDIRYFMNKLGWFCWEKRKESILKFKRNHNLGNHLWAYILSSTRNLWGSLEFEKLEDIQDCNFSLTMLLESEWRKVRSEAKCATALLSGKKSWSSKYLPKMFLVIPSASSGRPMWVIPLIVGYKLAVVWLAVYTHVLGANRVASQA